MCRTAIALFTAAAVVSLSEPLCAQAKRAQSVSSLDISATAVTYADSIHASGISITPAFSFDWPRATLGASATFSPLSNGESSIQASLAPSVFTPNVGIFSGEFAGAFGGSTHNDGSRTGQMLGVARLHAMGNGRGVWAGGGVGRTWDGIVWRSVHQTEFGAWVNRDNATALASLTPVVVQDTIRYADLQAAIRHPTRRFELGLAGGFRMGEAGPAIGGSSRAWGNVSVVAWISQKLALVTSAGSYPVDLTQGYPGGRFISISLRVASPNPRDFQERSDAASASSMPKANGALRFEVRSQASDSTCRELRVFAPSASAVEITADFTHWEPLHLTKGADGWWSASWTLAPGTYQMTLRLDGGRWIAPPGLLATRDEFGQPTGILKIE